MVELIAESRTILLPSVATLSNTTFLTGSLALLVLCVDVQFVDSAHRLLWLHPLTPTRQELNPRKTEL